MTAREKIDAAVDYLDGRGASFSYVAPPHYRLFWAMGLYLPPPHFQSALGLFIFNAFFFSLLFCGMVYFFEKFGHAFEVMLTVGLPIGVAVGLVVTALYRFQAWRLGLPRWSEFAQNSSEDASEDEEGWSTAPAASRGVCFRPRPTSARCLCA